MDKDIIDSIFATEPTIRFCESFNGTSPLWNYNLHCHPHIELIYRKTGHGRTDTVSGPQNFSFFDTMVYPVNCWHQDKFEASSKNLCYCLWVDMPGVTLPRPMQVQDRSGKLGNLFHSIFEEYQRSTPSAELLSLMVRTLLIQTLIFDREAPPTIADRVKQYLNVHLREKITLDELADISFVSKSYLSKQFKASTGMTIIEYLNAARVEQAKLLLVTTSKSVEEVAYDVGFDSPKYFFRLFKQQTQLTPLAFARQQKARS